MLMTDERLATLRVAYDDDRGRLTVEHGGRREVDADIRTAAGRDAVERFFERSWAPGRRAGRAWSARRAHVHRQPHEVRLADQPRERRRPRAGAGPAGRSAAVSRQSLRRGLPAWEEFDWLGREVGAGDSRFHVAERIDRCAATNVDPASGARDLNIPLTLRQNYGHIDCGVLCGYPGRRPRGRPDDRAPGALCREGPARPAITSARPRSRDCQVAASARSG